MDPRAFHRMGQQQREPQPSTSGTIERGYQQGPMHPQSAEPPYRSSTARIDQAFMGYHQRQVQHGPPPIMYGQGPVTVHEPQDTRAPMPLPPDSSNTELKTPL